MHTHNQEANLSKKAVFTRIGMLVITAIISLMIIYYSADNQIITETESSNTETQDYYLGSVTSASEAQKVDAVGELYFTQDVTVRLQNGPNSDEEFDLNYNLSATNKEDRELNAGATVVLNRTFSLENEITYVITDVYRLNSLVVMFIVFFSMTIFFTGFRGFTSIIGLVFSILVIIKFVVPEIVLGSEPLIISLLGALLIASVSIYLAHGVTKKTTIALVSTLLTITLTIVISMFAVDYLHLFGTGSEEARFLTSYLGNFNLQGLLLGGVILGTLGVLDDVTTAQTAAVEELKVVAPELKFKELVKKATSIGQEHILSLVNTLVLAYVGTSFPIFLLATINDSTPLWVSLNSEFIIEEIIRSIIGSMSLILAVPITTIIASYIFSTPKQEWFSLNGIKRVIKQV